MHVERLLLIIGLEFVGDLHVMMSMKSLLNLRVIVDMKMTMNYGYVFQVNFKF